MEEIVQVLKALGDETRLKILIILSQRRICAKGLSRHLGISEAAVSQHIKILKEADIISGEKTGYFVLYNLNYPRLLETAEFINQIGKENAIGGCRHDAQISFDCKAACKANKNMCCQKSEHSGCLPNL